MYAISLPPGWPSTRCLHGQDARFPRLPCTIASRPHARALPHPHPHARTPPTPQVESYHLRSEVVEARIKSLPVIKGFPVDSVPKAPYPNDSQVYTTLKARVRKEIFHGGEARGAHKRGGDFQVAVALGTALAALTAYLMSPGILTGCALGE